MLPWLFQRGNLFARFPLLAGWAGTRLFEGAAVPHIMVRDIAFRMTARDALQMGRSGVIRDALPPGSNGVGKSMSLLHGIWLYHSLQQCRTASCPGPKRAAYGVVHRMENARQADRLSG